MSFLTIVEPTPEKTGRGPWRWIALAWWNVSRGMIVARREVIDMFRDWRILVPIIILTGVFPYIATWGADRMLSYLNQYGATLIGDRLIPFLLLVVGFFPSSFSLIIALESFVGEKERRSLEPLLSTPLSDLQLYIGKMISSTLPPLFGSVLGISVYLFGIYYTVEWVASPLLLFQILALTVIQSVVMVAGAVVVSSQSTSVRAANLLASFIIIPMAFMIQAEAFIMFIADYSVLWLFMGGLLIICVLLVRMGVRTFNREELLGRELDEINFIALVKDWFNRSIALRKGHPRRSFWQWYQNEVLAALWDLRLEMLVIIIACFGVWQLGISYAETFRIPPELFHTESFGQRFQETVGATGLRGAGGILFVLFQNMRVLFVASLVAVFSFGIGMLLLLMVPVGLVSFLTTQLLQAGINPMLVFATVIPHGLLEVPAAVCAGAAALRLGACIIRPPEGKNVGDVWMTSLATATRLWWMLILPLLILGAIVEVTVTPFVVSWLAGA